jgi:hypothetical protein
MYTDIANGSLSACIYAFALYIYIYYTPICAHIACTLIYVCVYMYEDIECTCIQILQTAAHSDTFKVHTCFFAVSFFACKTVSICLSLPVFFVFYCLSPCVCPYISLSVCLWLSYLSVIVCLYVSVLLRLYLCVCLSLSVYLCLALSSCLSVFICLSSPLSIYLPISLSLTKIRAAHTHHTYIMHANETATAPNTDAVVTRAGRACWPMTWSNFN